LTPELEDAFQAIVVFDNATKEQRAAFANYLKAKAEWQQAEDEAAQWANVEADMIEGWCNPTFRG
jgi:hypothetical protein